MNYFPAYLGHLDLIWDTWSYPTLAQLGQQLSKLNDIPATGTSNDICRAVKWANVHWMYFLFQKELKSLFNNTIFAVKRKTSSKA